MKKTVLITGGAIRIGSKIAEHFAHQSWKVIIHYNSSFKEAIDLRQKLIDDSGNQAIYIQQADLENIDATTMLIKTINREIGLIDLLINNAAIFQNDDIDNIASEQLQKHLNVNLIAPIQLIQAFKRQYKGNDGNVINISDYAIRKPPKKFLSYMVSKSALFTATEMIAQMVAPNIRINSIGPGPTVANKRQSVKNFALACTNTLLGSGSSMNDICNTIEYILKTKSVTGHLFMLDSGRYLSNHDYN